MTVSFTAAYSVETYGPDADEFFFESDDQVNTITIDRDQWNELGQPSEITVVVAGG